MESRLSWCDFYLRHQPFLAFLVLLDKPFHLAELGQLWVG